MSRILDWIRRRWAEPESRAAVAAALGAIGAALAGKMDTHTMALAIATAALAFVFPSAPGGG